MKFNSIGFAFLVGVTITHTARTQQQILDLAQPGAKGVFVHLGADLLSVKTPRGKGVAYRVERREGQSGEWAIVARVTAPASTEEFRDRLTQAAASVPNAIDVSTIPANELWETIRRYGRIDSLGFWAGVLPVRVAAGAAYADLSAKPHSPYQYRVSLVDSGGNSLLTFRSSTVSFPGSPKFSRIRLVEYRNSLDGITLRWLVDQKPKPVAYLVYRQDGFGGEFETTSVSRVILTDGSSTFIVVQDTVVRSGGIYRYFLVPLDYHGNPGQPSDTAIVSGYDGQKIPLPEFLRASSDDSLGGIRLSWQLPQQEAVRSIRIFRSENFDSAFTAIGEIPASDSLLVDLNVVPTVKYIYYLVLVGPLGESSPPSAKFFGIFESAQHPLPPLSLRADRMRNGVRLRWPGSDVFLKGYYVYRSDGLSDSLMIISALIPAKDSLVSYTDSIPAEAGKRQYGYAVRSENTSHLLSAFSDTVWVSSPSAAIPVPTGFRGYAEESHAVLYWDDMYATEESVDGYLVHRRERTPDGRNWSAFRLLQDTLRPRQNNFTDTTIAPGRIYEYAIQTLGFPEGVSERSGGLQLLANTPIPPAPAGLIAAPVAGGITLRWNAVEDPSIKQTNIYRFQRGQKPVLAGSVTALEEPQFTDRNVRNGSLYFYYLTSESKLGKESSPCREVSIRPSP